MAITKYQDPNRRFASSGEFLDYLENTPRAPNWSKNGSSDDWEPAGLRKPSSLSSSDEWAGGSYKTATSYARHGWPDGVSKISDRLAVIDSSGYALRRTNDVMGDFPLIGRYLANQPDCMSRRRLMEGMKKPIVDILVNTSANSRISADVIMNRGAAIASLIDKLENSGYSVALDVACMTIANGLKTGPIVAIKRAGEPLNLADLVYYTAHPTFLRRLTFHYWETCFSGDQFDSGYGGACNATAKEENALMFPEPTSNSDWNTIEKAVLKVEETVRAQRPELLEGFGWKEVA